MRPRLLAGVPPSPHVSRKRKFSSISSIPVPRSLGGTGQGEIEGGHGKLD